MNLTQIADSLWGNRARFSYLLIASALLLLAMLGAKDIWTQEHRWADIVSGMFYRQDFLHPYLGENKYYDKPLLSYWLIVLIAKITGSLDTWTLRLPSALAGILAIFSIYRLGTQIKNKQLGLLAGWLMLTTFYFVFWARTSSADMLNLAGSLLAVAWYFQKRNHTSVFDYVVFFIILVLTSLCKGLIGAIVPLIAVATDMALQKSWRRHLRLSLFLSLIPALIIYLTPFLASSLVNGETYGQSGLYLVYRENVLRYFQPFDHQGPIYTYFIYLPLYLFPWAIFFLPALFTLKSRWATLSQDSKWLVWTTFLLFTFFTVSGSRRSYYVLPLVPFAILITADWILSGGLKAARRKLWATGCLILSFILLTIIFNIASPWYYSQFGVNRFVSVLKNEAKEISPWEQWQIVMLDAESKLNFYLQLPPNTKNYQIKGTIRKAQTTETLLSAWPILNNKPDQTIFITRKLYLAMIKPYFSDYQIVELAYPNYLPWIKKLEINMPVAFIPRQ